MRDDPWQKARERQQAQLLAEAREESKSDPLGWHLRHTNARNVTRAQLDRMIEIVTASGYKVEKR